MVYGNVFVTDESTNHRYTRGKQFSLEDLKTGDMPPHQGFFVKRELIEKVGLFDTQYKIAGDFDFIIRCFKAAEEHSRYLNRTIFALVFKDMITGLIKSFVFALLVGLTGCYMGFKVEGGAEGVGRRTTQSVVVSIFLIILADSFFTAIFYFLW